MRYVNIWSMCWNVTGVNQIHFILRIDCCLSRTQQELNPTGTDSDSDRNIRDTCLLLLLSVVEKYKTPDFIRLIKLNHTLNWHWSLLIK